MGLLKRRRVAERAHPEQASTLPLYQRLETLLVGGGDARLALSARAQCNPYGCTAYPRPLALDFASSTASNISEPGFSRAELARRQFQAAAAVTEPGEAFDARIEHVRRQLRQHLDLGPCEIVFSPSGSDAQLQALFLGKALLGAPLASIIAGADQTGGGTKHTAQGHHFSTVTARQTKVERGAPIAGLCEEVRSQGIDFCDAKGQTRSPREMDEAVWEAVRAAIDNGEKVLLQAMDSSKLGWRAPSIASLDAIAAKWPGQVQVVVDACQMRLSPGRLAHYLARNYLVLITGSKFFSGPAFSGALLVPQDLARRLDPAVPAPGGLSDYTTRYDWPRGWTALRAQFSPIPNYGQWLRWEAALEEMAGYFAVPPAFRAAILRAFAGVVPRLIADSPGLIPIARDNDSGEHPTIFSFVPQYRGEPLGLADCAKLYRALACDGRALLLPGAPPEAQQIAAQICLIGQPVALGPAAALRLSASARMVARCWTRRAPNLPEALAPELADVGLILQKLDWLTRNIERIADAP